MKKIEIKHKKNSTVFSAVFFLFLSLYGLYLIFFTDSAPDIKQKVFGSIIMTSMIFFSCKLFHTVITKKVLMSISSEGIQFNEGKPIFYMWRDIKSVQVVKKDGFFYKYILKIESDKGNTSSYISGKDKSHKEISEAIIHFAKAMNVFVKDSDA